MNAGKQKNANGIWKASKRVGALAALSLLAWIGSLLGRFAKVGEDMRCWALEKRDGLR